MSVLPKPSVSEASYQDSRIVNATEDYLCATCGSLMPRGYRHLFYVTVTGTIERHHVHCAAGARIKARCLEPRKRCQPMED